MTHYFVTLFMYVSFVIHERVVLFGFMQDSDGAPVNVCFLGTEKEERK